MSIGALWLLVQRHLWVMLPVATLVIVVGVHYVNQIPSIYQSEVSLLVDPERPQIIGVTPVMDQSTSSAAAFRDLTIVQQRVANSRDVLLNLSDRLSLHLHPEIIGTSDSPDLSEAGAEARQQRVFAWLRRNVEVFGDQNQRVLSISVQARDPALTSEVANELARLLVARQIERQLETTDSALSWLQEQLAELREAIDGAERAQFAYLRDQGTLSVSLEDRGNLSVQAVQTLSSQLATVRLEADRLGSTVRQLRALEADPDILAGGLQDTVEHSVIQSLRASRVRLRQREIELKERYGDEWGELRVIRERMELIEETLHNEIRGLIQRHQHNYETARLLERTLVSRLEAAQVDALRTGENEISFGALRRSVDSNRELYAMIERRLKELELSRMLQHNPLSLLEVASVPNRPIAPRRLQLIIGVVLLGLVLALLLAVVRELMDGSIRSQQAFESELGIPFLGIIPSIQKGRGRRSSAREPARGQVFSRDTFVADFPKSAVAESCRSIRTNLLFMDSETPLRSMMLTSAAAREGKTLTAVSLAVTFALGGIRVLIVDSDLRKPRLHRVFDVDSGYGVTNVLLGECDVEAACQATGVENLSLLPAGPVLSNPSEMMQSKAFRTLVDSLEERFDLVLFDTSPLMPVTDAVILATMVDGVVLVARSGKTRKDMFARCVDSLDAVQANIVGALLNDVDLTSRRHAGETYYYYYQQYGAYYQDEREA